MKVKVLFVPCGLLCTACFHESCSLKMERKAGGKVHPKLNMGLKLIANKYHEGNVKRTLKRKLEVPEIVERKANEIDRVKVDCFMCVGRVVLHTCCGIALLLALVVCLPLRVKHHLGLANVHGARDFNLLNGCSFVRQPV